MSYTILIVDDNLTIRHAIRTYFEQQNPWQVCGEAENGEQAVQLARELRPDVVLMDFQMPIMNGLDASRRIKHIAPATCIVMLTMHHSKELIREAQAAGIAQVLSKFDVVRERLLTTLKEIVLQARLRPEG